MSLSFFPQTQPQRPPTLTPRSLTRKKTAPAEASRSQPQREPERDLPVRLTLENGEPTLVYFSDSKQLPARTKTSPRDPGPSDPASYGEGSTSSNIPNASIELDGVNLDWMVYSPPKELYYFPSNIKPEIFRPLLEESVERLRTEEVEARKNLIELSIKENQSSSEERQDRNASNPSVNGQGHSRDVSKVSVRTSDSGYVSDPPSPAAVASSAAAKGKAILGALFRRTNKPAASSVVEPEAGPSTYECVSCFEDFSPSEVIKLTCHSYCKGCFLRLISNAMESEAQWPAKCCLNVIPPDVILNNINKDMKGKFQQRFTEWSVPVDNRVYCSRASCRRFIAPARSQKDIYVRCRRCGQKTCPICKEKHHGGMECPQDPDVKATMALAAHLGWRQCFSCHRLVEHNLGCRHMTCPCGGEFCYVCGAKWRTCECSDASLEHILQTAMNHQADEIVDMTLTDLDQEEEEAQILREVEEFERQEAEQFRLHVEALAREEAELHRRREEAHVSEVARRFRGLTLDLDNMATAQRTLLSKRHSDETSTLSHDSQEALSTLSIRHDMEIQLQTIVSRTIISDITFTYETEFQTRRTKERNDVENYTKAVKEYYADHPDGPEIISYESQRFRAEAAAGYARWDIYRRRNIKKVEDEEATKMSTLRKKQSEETCAAVQKNQRHLEEAKKREWAEWKWVHRVMALREEMLRELETVELTKVVY